MDPRVFRRVQRYGWDAATDAYDRGWVPLIERLTESCVARAALRPGERALDLATGTGVGAFAAARAVGASGAVTGLDVSEKMIALCARRAAADAHGNITFGRRDMEETGSPDAAFDAVTCAFGLMFAAERAAAFAEMARVTAPGGRVSICVWGRRAACGFAEVFPIVDAHVTSEVCPLFFSLGVPGAPTAHLRRAGFHDIVEESVPVTLSWASADEACAAMLEGGAVALAWNRFSAETRALVRAEYLASLEPFRRGERYDVAAEVMFATARKPLPATERSVPSLVTPLG
jgi:ubiquinone/menaquinone biosynthesis C-methylase UbiE